MADDNWILRCFTFQRSTGLLSYYEHDTPDYDDPRGRIHLGQTEVYIEMKESKSTAQSKYKDAPSDYILIVQTYGDLDVEHFYNAEFEHNEHSSKGTTSSPNEHAHANHHDIHIDHRPTSPTNQNENHLVGGGMEFLSSPIVGKNVFQKRERWILCCKSEEQQLIWYRAMKPFISHVKKKDKDKDKDHGNNNHKETNGNHNPNGQTATRGRLLSRDGLGLRRVSSLPPGETKHKRRHLRRRKNRANSDDMNVGVEPKDVDVDPDILLNGRGAAIAKANDSNNRKDGVTLKPVPTVTSLACFVGVNACCYFIRYGVTEWSSLAALLVLNCICGIMLRHVSQEEDALQKGKASSLRGGSSLLLTTKEGSVAKLDSMKIMSTKKVPAGTQTTRRAEIADTELLKIETLHGEQSKEFLRYVSSQTHSDSHEKQCYQVQPQTFWNVNPSAFKLRIGPDYKRNKQKAPSGPALFDLITMDIFNSDAGLKNVGDAFHMPNIPGVTDVETGHRHVPPMIVMNTMIPTDEPSLFKPKLDGPCCMAVLYLAISKQTLLELKDLKTASPAVKLLEEWCRRAEGDFAFRSRCKFMVVADDVEALGVPSFLTRYNGKPCLITSSGTLTRHRDAASHYLEMNVNIRMWNALARKGIHSLKPYIPSATFNLAITIEGRDNDELPEVLLGGCRMMNFDFAQAPFRPSS